MADLYHVFAQDLMLTPSGDLLVSRGDQYATQRVERRLLTNPGDYALFTSYGAGLSRYVGEPVDISELEAVVGHALRYEPVVEKGSQPLVQSSASGGIDSVQIIFTVAGGASSSTSQFPIRN